MKQPWAKWDVETVRHLANESPSDVVSECLSDFACLLELMRSTPPAKEPVSEECELKTGMHVGTQRPPLYAWPKDKRFNNGDRVRVVKIEETK